jgi:excisionase family DNA binding protein
MDKQLMTLKDVAEYARLAEKTVSRFAQTGQLPAIKVGRQWRFERAAVDNWLAARAATPEALQHLPPEATGFAAPLTVADAMGIDRIKLDLTSTDRDSILRELGALVIDPSEEYLSETLFRALKVREDLCSTAVGEGVAIPHSRNAIVGLVDEPVLAYGRHVKGIDFGALDGKPVHHFFLLCAPNVRQHLQLLAQLARLVRDPKFRDGLAAATEPRQIIELIQRSQPASS